MEQLKCPACGGTVNIDEDNAILFCPYCGAKMPQKQDSLDKILKHKENTLKFKEEVRQRKVQEKIEDENRQHKSAKVAVFISIIALIAFGLVCYFGIQGENKDEAKLQALVSEIQVDLEAGNYDIALFKTEQLYWPHSDLDGKQRWNKQREGLVKVIKEAQKNAGK